MLVVALAVIAVWRRLGINYNWPLYAQYSTPLYIVIIVFVMETLWQICKILNHTAFLDSATTRTAAMDGPAIDMEAWEAEASLQGYPWLIWFSLSMPVWMLLNVIVCASHTVQHLKLCRKGGLLRHPQHDMTVCLLALPAIYGMMSLRGVMDVLLVVTNAPPTGFEALGDASWDELTELAWEAYEVNFMVADLYESVALLAFARITMRLLQAKVTALQNQEIHKVLNVANELSARLAAVPHSPEAAEEEGVADSIGEAVKGGFERTHEVVDSLTAQTLNGMQYFNLSCCFQSIYFLLITSFEYLGAPIPHLSDPATKSMAKTFFLGLGTMSSCAAIHSLMILEHDYGHKYLQGFNCATKFWSRY